MGTEVRYYYSTGHKTREAAEMALEEMYALADVTEGERPLIEPYTARNGHRRYAITLPM